MIRGANNQLLKFFYKFVHVKQFNIKHTIAHLQVV